MQVNSSHSQKTPPTCPLTTNLTPQLWGAVVTRTALQHKLVLTTNVVIHVMMTHVAPMLSVPIVTIVPSAGVAMDSKVTHLRAAPQVSHA